MAHAIRRNPALTLNTDGKPHPRENTLASVTFVLGLIAVVSSLLPSWHLVSCWVGLVAMGLGAVSHMISKTTPQRFLNVIGFGAAAIGFGLGLANGGLI